MRQHKVMLRKPRILILIILTEDNTSTISGFLIFGLASIRDNTSILEFINGPSVSGQIYFEDTMFGRKITGVGVNNGTDKSLIIQGVVVTTYSSYHNRQLSYDVAYPYNHTSMQSAGYGTAEPHSTSGIVSIGPYTLYQNQYAVVNIRVVDACGLYGSTSGTVTNP